MIRIIIYTLLGAAVGFFLPLLWVGIYKVYIVHESLLIVPVSVLWWAVGGMILVGFVGAVFADVQNIRERS